MLKGFIKEVYFYFSFKTSNFFLQFKKMIDFSNRPDGRVDFRVDVPKYPLSWVINGLSVSRNLGLGIMQRPIRVREQCSVFVCFIKKKFLISSYYINLRALKQFLKMYNHNYNHFHLYWKRKYVWVFNIFFFFFFDDARNVLVLLRSLFFVFVFTVLPIYIF